MEDSASPINPNTSTKTINNAVKYSLLYNRMHINSIRVTSHSLQRTIISRHN